MNQNDKAIEVGIANAVSAIDQVHAYDDARASYRQNVIDTMDELGLIDHRDEALAAFDAHIQAHALNRHTLVWAVIGTSPEYGYNVEGVFYTFEEAKLVRDDMKIVWPGRQFKLQVTFIRNPS